MGSRMRIAVTGGTGYLGPAVVQAFLDAGHDVVVLEHKRPVDVPDSPRLRRAKGDVLDPESLKRAFDGCEAVAHLVAIIREAPKKGVTFERVHVEGTRNVVQAAKATGARRFLLMSANGADDADTPYFRTKLEMERMVKEAGFSWTVFRPGYIAGSRAGGFDAQFAGIVDKAPVLPLFAGGKFEIQPVSRRDVALAFARALERPLSVGRTYVLVGPERFTWKEYLRRLAKVRGRTRLMAYAPGPVVIGMAKTLGSLFPADPDQLRMLMRGNVGDAEPALKDLGLAPLERWEDAVAGLRR